jgi:uncharacterized protein YidB (DUF937 family)
MNMARGMPSLAALLGLVAVAGYQNRDKIGEFVKGLKSSQGGATIPGGIGTQGRPEQATDMMGSGYSGSPILGGIGELIEQFTGAGKGEKAKSWVATGPNESIDESELEQTLGPDMIDRLTQQTGLDRQELLKRLSRTLPDAVDQMTPDGRIPNAAAG